MATELRELLRRASLFAGLDDAALAAELAALRILPGERIEVLEGIPYGGPVVIQTAGGTYALGRRLAGRITVRGQP